MANRGKLIAQALEGEEELIWRWLAKTRAVYWSGSGNKEQDHEDLDQRPK